MSVIEREATESPTVGESGCLVRPVTTVLDPRVERGAALLDEKMPGWADGFDVDDFSLNDGRKCVLGQVGLCVNDEAYRPTVRKLLSGADGYGSSTEREHGFFAARGGPKGFWDPVDAGLLEQDWRLAILSRRLPA